MNQGGRRSGRFLLLVVVGGIAWFLWANRDRLFLEQPALDSAPPPRPFKQVSALGRIEPRHGLIRLAGPPRSPVVIKDLRVEEGDAVKAGQIIALVEGIDLLRADVDRFRAELATAEREFKRRETLHRGERVSESDLDSARLRVDMAKASLDRATADLEMSTVRAPIDGQVLKIHSRRGEAVGEKGIAELGDTGRMYAVAEVYENDIGRVKVGHRARITSPALSEVLTGTVEAIGLLIGKKDILKTDPVADADARVVEVDIRLDNPEAAARLTNLRVDIVIQPGNGP